MILAEWNGDAKFCFDESEQHPQLGAVPDGLRIALRIDWRAGFKKETYRDHKRILRYRHDSSMAH
jgi:hypothetical protein